MDSGNTGVRRASGITRAGSVLVVDDESDVRDIFRELLQEEGFRVALATEGRSALEQLARLPRPCTVLLDLQMPGLDGPGFLRALEEDAVQRADVRVIVVTARNTLVSSALVVQRLLKPVDLGRLLELLDGRHAEALAPRG